MDVGVNLEGSIYNICDHVCNIWAKVSSSEMPFQNGLENSLHGVVIKVCESDYVEMSLESWGDERFTSHKSKFSNFKLVNTYLFKNIEVKQNQIFAIDTNKKSALFAAKNYEKKIKSYFKKKFFSFDLILLGMGMDGHIASLYPKDKDILSKKIVRNVHGEDFDRITIGLNLINKAKKICLWLPTVKKKKYYYKISNIKKKPVNLLKKNKMTVFSILQ